MSRTASIGIAATAKQTGLSAHTLRAWERRYGFPLPRRAGNGERLYAVDQVRKLSLLRGLIARGHRPARIVQLPEAELAQMASDHRVAPAPDAARPDWDAYFQCLSDASAGDLRRLLRATLVRHGLSRFIADTLGPLQRQIGTWWETGRIETAQENLFSEQVERLLREAMTPLDETYATKIVLTTFPSERHGLGLLMVEALLRLEGASCIPIGLETPPAQLPKLVAQSGADILALSFSAAYDNPDGRRLLSGLRDDLPAQTALWVGGEGAVKIARSLRGVSVFRDLDEMVAAFRQRHAFA